jgi:radical SAM protein with 4Fe4S-binding SPASM domain
MLKELALALNRKPNYLYFMVTSRCNAFCDFCWNWKNVEDAGKFAKVGDPTKRNELTIKEIELFTKNLPNMLLVDLYGGEPFLRQDIDEIIALFVKNCKVKYISIPTNGFYTNKILTDIESSLKRFPNTFFRLYISIDGPPVVHDRIRKVKDGFMQAMKTAKGLGELRDKYTNLSVSVNSNYNLETQDTMDEFVTYLLDLELFDSVNVGMIRGEPYRKDLLTVDVMRYFKIVSRIKNRKNKSKQPFSALHEAIEDRTKEFIKTPLNSGIKREFKCFAGKKITVVSDQGDVFPCEEMLDRPIGNIRDFGYSLKDVLKTEEGKKIRKSIQNRECDCRWECAINTSSIFDVFAYPKLLYSVAKKVLK